jgi:hypothetical protein
MDLPLKNYFVSFILFSASNTRGALVQFHGNRSVIESSRQIGLCLSYVIDPINPKMRAMTWNYCDLSARYATLLTYNITRPILQRIMTPVSFTNVGDVLIQLMS